MDFAPNWASVAESVNYVSTNGISGSDLTGLAKLGLEKEAPKPAMCAIFVLLARKDAQSAIEVLDLAPTTQNTSLYRWIVQCGANSEPEGPTLSNLLTSFWIFEPMLASCPEILLWAYSRLVIMDPQLILAKFSVLKKTSFLNYTPKADTPYQVLVLEAMYVLQREDAARLYAEGEYTECVLRLVPFVEPVLGGEGLLKDWLMSNSSIKDVVTLVFKGFVLQVLDYDKFQVWRLFQGLLKSQGTILDYIDEPLYKLVEGLCYSVVPMNTLQPVLRHCFPLELHITAQNAILELNLVQISFKFITITMSTLERLIGQERCLGPVLGLKARKILLVDIDQVANTLAFHHARPSKQDLRDSILAQLHHSVS